MCTNPVVLSPVDETVVENLGLSPLVATLSQSAVPVFASSSPTLSPYATTTYIVRMKMTKSSISLLLLMPLDCHVSSQIPSTFHQRKPARVSPTPPLCLSLSHSRWRLILPLRTQLSPLPFHSSPVSRPVPALVTTMTGRASSTQRPTSPIT